MSVWCMCVGGRVPSSVCHASCVLRVSAWWKFGSIVPSFDAPFGFLGYLNFEKESLAIWLLSFLSAARALDSG